MLNFDSLQKYFSTYFSIDKYGGTCSHHSQQTSFGKVSFSRKGTFSVSIELGEKIFLKKGKIYKFCVVFLKIKSKVRLKYYPSYRFPYKFDRFPVCSDYFYGRVYDPENELIKLSTFLLKKTTQVNFSRLGIFYVLAVRFRNFLPIQNLQFFFS